MSFDMVDLPSLSLEPRCTPSQEYRPPVKSIKRKPVKRNFATARAERGHIRTHHAHAHAQVLAPPSRTVPVTQSHPRLTSTPRATPQTPQTGQITSSAVLHTPNPHSPSKEVRKISNAPTWRTRPNTPPPTVPQTHTRPITNDATTTSTPVPRSRTVSPRPSPQKKTTPATTTVTANPIRGKGKSFVPPRPVGVMPITSHLPSPDKTPSAEPVHIDSNAMPRKGRTGPRQKVKSLLLGVDPKTKTKPVTNPKSKSKQARSHVQSQAVPESQGKSGAGAKERPTGKNREKEVIMDEAEDGEWDEHGLWRSAPTAKRVARRVSIAAVELDELAEDEEGAKEEETSIAVEKLHENITKWLSDVESDTAEVQSAHSDPDPQAPEPRRRRLTIPARRKSALATISLEKEHVPLSLLTGSDAHQTDQRSLVDQQQLSICQGRDHLTAQPRPRTPSVDCQHMVTNQHLDSFGRSPTPSLHNAARFPTPPQTRQRPAPAEGHPVFLPHSDSDDDDDNSEDEGSVNEPICRSTTRRSRDPRAIYALSSPFWDDSESQGAPPTGRSRRTRSISSTNDFGNDENNPREQTMPSGLESRRHYPLSPSLAPSSVPAEKANRRRSVSFAAQTQMIERGFPPLSRRKVTTFKSSRKSGAPPPLGERKRRRRGGEKISGGKASKTRGRRKVDHRRTRERHSRVSKFIDDEAVEDNEEDEEEVTEAGSDEQEERSRGASIDARGSIGEETIQAEGMVSRDHGARSGIRQIGEVLIADDDPYAYIAEHAPPLRSRDIPPQPYNVDNVDASPLRLDQDEMEEEDNDPHNYRHTYEKAREEDELEDEGEEGDEVGILESPFHITPPTQNPNSAPPPGIRGRKRKLQVRGEVHRLTSVRAGRKRPSGSRIKSKKAGSLSHWVPSDEEEEEDEYDAMIREVNINEDDQPRKKVARGKQKPRKRPGPNPQRAGSEDTGDMREVTKALSLRVDRDERWDWDDTVAHEEWQGKRGRRASRRHAWSDEEDEEEETGIRKAGKLSLSRNDSVAENQARYVSNLPHRGYTRTHPYRSIARNDTVPLPKATRRNLSHAEIANNLPNYVVNPIATVTYEDFWRQHLEDQAQGTPRSWAIDQRLVQSGIRAQSQAKLESLARKRVARQKRRFDPIRNPTAQTIRGLPVRQESPLEDPVGTLTPSAPMPFGTLSAEQVRRGVGYAAGRSRVGQLRFTASTPPARVERRREDQEQRAQRDQEQRSTTSTRRSASQAAFDPNPVSSIEQLHLPRVPRPSGQAIDSTHEERVTDSRRKHDLGHNASFTFSATQEVEEVEAIAEREGLSEADLRKLIDEGALDGMDDFAETTGETDAQRVDYGGGLGSGMGMEEDPVTGEDFGSEEGRTRGVVTDAGQAPHVVARAVRAGAAEGERWGMSGLELGDHLLTRLKETVQLFQTSSEGEHGQGEAWAAASKENPHEQGVDAAARTLGARPSVRTTSLGRKERRRDKSRRTKQRRGVTELATAEDGLRQGLLTFKSDVEHSATQPLPDQTVSNEQGASYSQANQDDPLNETQDGRHHAGPDAATEVQWSGHQQRPILPSQKALPSAAQRLTQRVRAQEVEGSDPHLLTPLQTRPADTRQGSIPPSIPAGQRIKSTQFLSLRPALVQSSQITRTQLNTSPAPSSPAPSGGGGDGRTGRASGSVADGPARQPSVRWSVQQKEERGGARALTAPIKPPQASRQAMPVDENVEPEYLDSQDIVEPQAGQRFPGSPNGPQDSRSRTGDARDGPSDRSRPSRAAHPTEPSSFTRSLGFSRSDHAGRLPFTSQLPPPSPLRDRRVTQQVRPAGNGASAPVRITPSSSPIKRQKTLGSRPLASSPAASAQFKPPTMRELPADGEGEGTRRLAQLFESKRSGGSWRLC